MNTALIVARLALLAVFAVAAFAKVADLPGSRRALEGFGVPLRFVSVGAIVLPTVELLTAVLMLAPETARAGGVLGAFVLTVFIAGIGQAIRRGRTPDCHCFGQLHSKPAGIGTIVRNLLLLCTAIFVAVAGPGQTFGTWTSERDAAQLALVAIGFVAAVLAVACTALWQENRDLKGHGRQAVNDTATLLIGQPAPSFLLVDTGGAIVSSRNILDGTSAVLVFISSSCGPCAALLPSLAGWKKSLEGRLGIHVVAAGDEREIRRLASEHGIEILLDPDEAVSREWRIPATPSAIEVDSRGIVATRPASGGPAVEGLIRVVLKRPPGDAAVRVQQVRPVDPTPVTD